MEIWKIDKNFAPGNVQADGDVTRYAIPCAPFDLYGVYFDDAERRFVRLPADVAAATNEGVVWLRTHTSGGRLRFATDSDYIEIAVRYNNMEVSSHIPLSATAGFILTDETDENRPVFAAAFRPEATSEGGFAGSAMLAGGKMRQYTLYFPLYNEVTGVQIGLKEGARVAAGRPYRPGGPVLYYGSSITQGGCASRPGNAYTSMLCRALDAPQINLGFSGSARGETALAREIGKLPLSAFVYDYDYNAPSADHLAETHEPFFRIIRELQPDLPILMLSKCDYRDDPECNRRREIIRTTFRNARKRGDRNVCFIDGETLFGRKMRDACTVDGIHPNDLGFYRMYKRILPALRKILKKRP